MERNQPPMDRRITDPYLERRSGEYRRQVYGSDYWGSRGIEKRSSKDRRQQKERRTDYVNVSKCASVCKEDKANQ